MRRIRLSLLAIAVSMMGLGLAGPFHGPAAGLVDRAHAVVAAGAAAASCASIDKRFSQIDVPLAGASGTAELGRVFSLSDGTIAVLVIVSGVTSDGSIGTVGFSASVKVSAAIVHAGNVTTTIGYDPPVRSKTGISAPNGSPIDALSLCYRISIPSPPAPASPGATAPASRPSAEAAQSPTPIVFEINAVQTVQAEASAQVAAAQATAAAAQSAQKQSRTQAAQLQATVAVQTSRIAELQATLSVPTPTPSPTAVSNEAVLLSATSDQDFAQFSLPATGWKIDNGLVAGGGGTQDWVSLPSIPGLGADQAIEAEIKINDGGQCPRNFGMALRGTQDGYVAGGVEWACDQAVKLWTGQTQIAQGTVPALGNDWHLFRLEVRGRTVRFLIDGQLVLESTTDQATGGQLAIWTGGVALQIRSIRVLGLS